MFGAELEQRARQILETARSRKIKITTAESCTGGLIAALFTSIAGSSDVFERGFVTYSNEAKNQMLGVHDGIIAQHGAVSEEVATLMAEGALTHSFAQLSVSVTGIAGPGGGSEHKPVGLVYIASAMAGARPIVQKHQFNGDREAVRLQSLEAALTLLEGQFGA